MLTKQLNCIDLLKNNLKDKFVITFYVTIILLDSPTEINIFG